ncbi:MAG: hypothetical protein JZU65_12725 [Chlorobium sp.]|jgi:hypothetical protein|nr:hypothetical protein [Chlorobium sp.]
MAERRWINEKEVVVKTGRGLQSLRNDRSQKCGIPYSKIGKSIRYAVDDVDAWMEARRISTADDPRKQNVAL